MTINKRLILNMIIVLNIPVFLYAMSENGSIAHPYEKAQFSADIHLYGKAHKRTLSQQKDDDTIYDADAPVTQPKPLTNSEEDKITSIVIGCKNKKVTAPSPSKK